MDKLFDTLPKLPLSISGTRVIVTYLLVYSVVDLVGKFR